AEEALKRRKCVCDGFAELFSELAKNAGLKVWKVKGKAKGVHYIPGDSIDNKKYAHAWNCTTYKGEFLFIDSTWGAGHLTDKTFEKRFEPFYFLTRPTSFIFTHLPDDEKEQYLSPPLTKEEFLNLNNVKPPFFAAGMEFREYIGHTITTNDDLIDFEITRYHPDEGQPLHAILLWNGKEVDVMIQRVVGYDASSGKVYRLQTACPSRGEGKLEIYVMFEGNKGPLAACFRVVNKGSGKNYSPFVKTFRVPFKFSIEKPTHLNLKYNKEYKFEFTIFDMKEEQHPEFSLFSPEKNIRKFHKISKCQDGSFTYGLDTKVDQKGDWKLVFSSDGKHFDFIAQYHVD
ncbi:18401_t:CDS:2, partial [Racocetra fulgida]